MLKISSILLFPERWELVKKKDCRIYMVWGKGREANPISIFFFLQQEEMKMMGGGKGELS